MKAFHSLKGLYRGGVENLVMNWLRHVDHTQHTFDFGVTAMTATKLLPEIESYGGKVFSLTKGTSAREKMRYLRKLYVLLKQNGVYESFFSHEQFFGSVTCAIAWAAGIKKRVTVAHWSVDYHTSPLKKKLSQLLSRLFVTHRLAVSAEAGRVQFGSLPFTIIHTGIDTQQFAFNPAIRTQIRRQLDILPDAFVLGNVSRLSADKNLFFLVDVFEKIRQQQPRAVLLQCGAGVLERELKEYVAQKNLTHCVRFVGNVPDVFKYYQAMDAFVFPSFKEGLGIVAVEAQCSGLPCFISDGVPNEAMICNTTKIPLSQSADEWATLILEKVKHFKRVDCSAQVKQAGFEVHDTACEIVHLFLSQESKS